MTSVIIECLSHIFPTTVNYDRSLLSATLRLKLTLSPPHQPKPNILLLLVRHEDVRPVAAARVLASRLPIMIGTIQEQRAQTVPDEGEDHDRSTSLCWNFQDTTSPGA